MYDYSAELKHRQSLVENYLNKQCFIYPDEPQQTLFEAMRYSLLAGGKRLRPVMTLEFCRMCGGSFEQALPFAAAIEMVQTYSLIHDDLPCMDNDDFRRGKPTNHKVFGEATAVLAGDALLTAAFGYLTNAPLNAEARIQAVSVLSACAGELGMVGGQVLDMASEYRACTRQEILDIQSRKTGALICASCMLGVIAGGGTAEQLQAASDFAHHLGLAFQIRDDILDVIGDPEAMGKAVGTDQNKNTFVRLYGISLCEDMVLEHTNAAVAALNVFSDRIFLTNLANSLVFRTI